MKTMNHFWNHLILAFAAALMVLGAASVAFAQDEDTQTPAEEEVTCGEVIRQCDTGGLFDAYSAMRQGCQAFRQCKNNCGAAKSSCKSAARAAKRNCSTVCKSKKGKAKKSCKKKCKNDKKTAKAKCKNAKKSCKNTCKSSLKSTSCTAARNTFWREFTRRGQDCGTVVEETCESPFPKR